MNNIFRKRSKEEIKNVDYYLSITFFILIILGGLLNTFSNKTYLNDSWTIGEWLINYQGGFVRRGFLGEGIYFLLSLNVMNCCLCDVFPSYLLGG